MTNTPDLTRDMILSARRRSGIADRRFGRARTILNAERMLMLAGEDRLPALELAIRRYVASRASAHYVADRDTVRRLTTEKRK